MEKKWTAAQLKAIGERDRTLLVSAAAGSGKTATLTERIIRTLTDPERPADLSRLLIVTFTRAAAAELKERISGALSDALAKNPADKNLLRQFMLLPSAKISTIDSFCLNIVRTNHQRLGLPPNFRIDEAESDLLGREVMNELINECYDSPETETDSGAARFTDFADQLIGAKNDGLLSGVLLALYKKLLAYPESTELLRRFANRLKEEAALDFFATAHGKIIKAQILKRLAHFEAAFAAAMPRLAANENAAKSYLPTFEHNLALLHDLKRAVAGGYSHAAGFLKENTVKALGRLKTEYQTGDTDWAKEVHGAFNNYIKKNLLEIVFAPTPGEIAETAGKTAAFCRRLYLILSEFESRLRTQKIKNSLCDYADLAHNTLRLLCDGDSPTQLARHLAAQYDAIYIDEYQDINPVQDKIFRCIAEARNRFMVGDLKQSIYAFRGASPEIFAKMRAEYPPLDTAAPEDDNATVFMSSNFRCDRPIVNFVNTLFETLFTYGSKQLGYRKEDGLIFAKEPAAAPKPVRVVLIDTTERADGSRPPTEPQYIAAEIARLLREGRKNDGEPIRPGDIAILLRNANARSRPYEQALEAVGIPYYSEVPGDFFENAEVSLMMSLLHAIDNPRRDIYLAGALCSPLFGFTLDELIEIRRHTQPDLPLYDAIESYCALYDYPKGQNFLETLGKYRALAQGMPVDKLLWRLYRETAALSLVKGEKKDPADIRVRRTNLMLLYEYARQYEAGSFKGLYSFIQYVNGIIDEGKRLESAKPAGESEDTVKITSIHKSKGLEFPVCFVADTLHRHSSKDTQTELVFDSELGPAVRLRDETGLARCDTPHRRAVAAKIDEQQTEEELRILYVALTRARERLYVTAGGKADKLLESAEKRARVITEQSIGEVSNYFEWILTVLHATPTDACRLEVVRDIGQMEPVAEAVLPGQAAAEPPPDDKDAEEACYNTLLQRFVFQYPYAHMSRIPAKLSVSKLFPGVLDEPEETVLTLREAERAEIPRQSDGPAFISRQTAASAADSGTATHLFMQFCDLEYLVRAGTKKEIERLIVRQFITEDIAALINLEHIRLFVESDLFARLQQAKKLYREFRFNLKLPAPLFTEDPALKALLTGEDLLVQGVIDCLFEEADGTLSLVDYKTDFLTPYEIAHPEAAEKKLVERHRQQLFYYAEAVRRMMGRAPDRICIYSLPSGREIPVDVRPKKF